MNDVRLDWTTHRKQPFSQFNAGTTPGQIMYISGKMSHSRCRDGKRWGPIKIRSQKQIDSKCLTLYVQSRPCVNLSVNSFSHSYRREERGAQGHSPLIELPPLSPGIQARVMEEVEVVETVRRGWSGGTAEETPRVNPSIIPLCKHYGIFKSTIVRLFSQCPTLH